VYVSVIGIAASPVSTSSTRLQRCSKTNMLAGRTKVLKQVNVGVVATEESEMSDCSLDISCSTVTRSASSLSEPDQEARMPMDGLMRVLKRDEAESNEVLSDCSTVSAENSTASAPSASDAEQENTLRQRQHVLMANNSHKHGEIKNETMTARKDFDADCGISCSNANITVCQPVAVSSTDNSNKDQVVISASTRVQNYLASLGLPGIFVYVCVYMVSFQHACKVNIF